MSSTDSKSPCVGFGGMLSGVHWCPSRFVNMHSFFGTPLGKEGSGQPVHCPRCETKTVLTPNSASPIVAMFALGLCSAESTLSKTYPSRLMQAPALSPPPLSNTETNPSQGKRSPHSVSTIAQRIKVVCWLADKEEKGGWWKGLLARSVDEFPDIFNSVTRNANLTKAASWWKGRDKILGSSRKHWWDEEDHGEVGCRGSTRAVGRV
uniref:AlNc14C216G9016 protein n=1 Tax=Albugo laibachii Nc14 TaxID=890382 RepID=F0WRL5_9STRA|nr:AlNc14C216G9016 [Albugo laibachii Nc14]|eukprot:CCA23979.1 AlNc14C216G9016 [Albugo laibachii Nc14]